MTESRDRTRVQRLRHPLHTNWNTPKRPAIWGPASRSGIHRGMAEAGIYLMVSCPDCDAPPNEYCRLSTGTRVGFHPQRRRRAALLADTFQLIADANHHQERTR